MRVQVILYNSHIKKNSLDTRDDFVEILKYVEKSEALVYREHRSIEIATVSEMQDINSESCFLCQDCRKTYKAKRGLNRHQLIMEKAQERLPLNAFEQFVTIRKVKLANDQCVESFMEEFSAYFLDKEYIKNGNKLISNVASSCKGDAEKLCPIFYKCISDSEV